MKIKSADVFLGVPFNLTGYAVLTMMIAQCVDMLPGEFVHTFGDVHAYSNHIEQLRLQLTREPYPLPTLKLNPEVKDIFSFTLDDFEILDHQQHPAIKGDVAV